MVGGILTKMSIADVPKFHGLNLLLNSISRIYFGHHNVQNGEQRDQECQLDEKHHCHK